MNPCIIWSYLQKEDVWYITLPVHKLLWAQNAGTQMDMDLILDEKKI